MTSLYFFNQSLARPVFLNHFLTGIFALLCFFTKYNFGLVVLFTELICYLIILGRERKTGKLAQRSKAILLAWLPILGLLVFWLFVLDEWQWLVAYSNAQPSQYGFWTIENLLFYPRQLLRETSGWVPLILTITGLVLWIWRHEFPKTILAYLVFFMTAFCMLTYETQDSSRFGMMLLPPLWIMSAGGLVVLLEQVPIPRVRYLALGGFLVLLAFSSFRNLTTIATRLGIAYENLDTSVDAAYRFIAESIRVDRSTDLNVIMYGNTTPGTGCLHFFRNPAARSRTDCVIHVMDERERKVYHLGFSQAEREERIEQALVQGDYLVTFSKSPVTPEGWIQTASQDYEFHRRNVKPVRNWVVVFRHE
jgi:hypothetical protein